VLSGRSGKACLTEDSEEELIPQEILDHEEATQRYST
jgi:hypothetical protein